MWMNIICCLIFHIGGLLRKSAEALGDEKVLIDIRGKDMVAIEVRYHRSCYREYIKVSCHPENSIIVQNSNSLLFHEPL